MSDLKRTGVDLTQDSKKINDMKIMLFIFLAWGVIGFGYFVYDTMQNEERWSRDPGSNLEFFAAGPIVWIFYAMTVVAGSILSLLALIRGR